MEEGKEKKKKRGGGGGERDSSRIPLIECVLHPILMVSPGLCGFRTHPRPDRRVWPPQPFPVSTCGGKDHHTKCHYIKRSPVLPLSLLNYARYVTKTQGMYMWMTVMVVSQKMRILLSPVSFCGCEERELMLTEPA